MPKFVPPPVFCLAGTTASGKSEVGVALARALVRAGAPGAEVVSCDAYAIYRHMPILTASPDAPTDVPHHLVGILDPEESYDAARYVRDADHAVAAIRARGHVPLLVGGTALYLRAWLTGLDATAPKDPAFRETMQAIVRREGPAALHAMLERVDPERARVLHPNDVRRVGRALEIHHTTGRPASAQRQTWDGPLREPAQVVVLARRLEDIDARIAQRTRAMFEAGVVDEVRALLTRTLSPQARQVLGLRDIEALLAGEQSHDDTVEALARKTRRFARKQRTFFARFPDPRVVELAVDATPEAVVARILDQADSA